MGDSFQPFSSELAGWRVVQIPTGLDDAARRRFVSLVTKAVEHQARLAERCDAIVQVNGRVEEAGQTLLIPHEEVSPADPKACLREHGRPDIRTLWWLTWALLRGLAAAQAERVVHGGIQAGAVFVDSLGRPKLGDFGLAPAFEMTCGGRARRQVVCEPGVSADADGRRLSGRWVLLEEQTSRQYGWIAPYFPHELLEDDNTPLNPKSDQFSLGTLLFLWATGNHPYDAALSDPSLNFYFHFDPAALELERPGWAKCFQHQRGDLVTSADRPVLAWDALVRRLLASDTSGRFAQLAEAEQMLAEQVPPAWGQAAAAIEAALPLLPEGRPEEFLTQVSPLAGNQALPELWRQRVAGRVAEVEAQKQVIVRRRALVRQLEQAQELLDGNEIQQARLLAREVADAPECDEPVREQAQELVQQCEEQERAVHTFLDEQAREALEAADEALARGDFNDARICLNTVVQDPTSPDHRIAQARRKLAEIEQAEQRYNHQRGELDRARAEHGRDKLDEARRRLETLLSESPLADALASPARRLLEQVKTQQQLALEYGRILSSAEQAWQQADAASLEELVASVPAALPSAGLARRRDALAERLGALRGALAERGDAERHLEADNAVLAATVARRAVEAGELPPRLAGELEALVRRCDEVIGSQRQAAVENAVGALGQAEQAYEAGDAHACRTILTERVLPTEALPAKPRRAAKKLLDRCERLRRARELLDEVESRIGADDLEGAARDLEALQPAELPAVIGERAAELRRRLKQAGEELAQRARTKLEAQLRDAEQSVAAGDLDAVEPQLKAVEQSPHFSEELADRVAALRSTLAEQRPIARTLAIAEAVLERGDWQPVPGLISRGGSVNDERVAPLPAELPAWAQARAEAVHRRIAELEQQQRDAQLAGVQAALDAAEEALQRGDPAAAENHLRQAGAVGDLEPALARRHQALGARVRELEEWLREVQALEAALQANQIVEADERARRLLESEAVPGPVGERLKAVHEAAEARIAARQNQLAAELGALERALERRGRRARDFEQRVEAAASDPLVTEEQKTQAATLLERFQALPEPRRSKLPMVAGAVVAVVAVAAAVGYLTRSPPPEPLAEVIARNPPRITGEYTLSWLVEKEDAPLGRLLLALGEWEAGTDPALEFPSLGSSEAAWHPDPDDERRAWWPVTVNAAAVGAITVEVGARHSQATDAWEDWRFALGDAAMEAVVSWVSGRIENDFNPRVAKRRVTQEECNKVVSAYYELDPLLRAKITAPKPLPRPKVEPSAAKLLRASPPHLAEWPRLSELVHKSSPELSVLIASAPDEVDQQIQYPEFEAQTWTVSPDDPSVTQQVAVGWADMQFHVKVTVPCDKDCQAWKDWQFEVPQAALEAMARAVQDQIAASIASLGDGGELLAAWERYQAVKDQVGDLPGALNTGAVARAMERLPPAWEDADVSAELYEPVDGEADRVQGYPSKLRDKQNGGELLLVFLSPQDELWITVELSGEGSWLIFYIDAAEQESADSFVEAQDAAKGLERELPTKREWMLAALRFDSEREPDDRKFVGGKYEWCADNSNDGDDTASADGADSADGQPEAHWVCGGCTLSLSDQKGGLVPKLVPKLAKKAVAADLWNWLNQRLVSHRRRHGDGLTSFRTVLRVHPGLP